MGFLHGVETIEVKESGQTIRLVRTSVIGLVGIAPLGNTNELMIISSEREGVEKLGSQIPGFSIPKALASIFAQGPARVMVVNVFDSTTMTLPVTAESLVILNGKVTLGFAPVGGDPVITDQAGAVTFTAGTDYEIDAFGNLVVLNFTSIAEGSTILATYKKIDPTTVTDVAVSGSIVNGNRTGFKKFGEAYNLFGYAPKILICPEYCERQSVAAELIVAADSLRAVAIIDAANTASVPDAITGRGPAGTLAGFKTSNRRTILCFPYLKAYDPATDSIENRPFSSFLAGVMSANPNYWESPSNKEIKGITGASQTITAGISDQNSDANQLNEAGIVTLFASFGTGTRTWGNRNASFPTSTTMDNFIPIQRVKDILHESLELAQLNNIDKPITQALVDTIRQSGQAFMNTLIGRGALMQGSKVSFYDADNPASQVAAGHLCFDIEFAGPTPAERITFKSRLNAALLVGLGG